MTHILHTADWQIGRQYGQFDSGDAAMLAEARYDAVARIAELAAQRGVDAVLVAGDVFDTQGISDRGIRRLFARATPPLGDDRRQPRRRAGRQRLDPRHPAGLRARQCACAAALGVVDLPGANLAVLAAPLTQRHTYDDVTQAFDLMESEAGRVRVGLAHGSVTGRLPETIDATNPIAADRAARAVGLSGVGRLARLPAGGRALLVCGHARAGSLPGQ